MPSSTPVLDIPDTTARGGRAALARATADLHQAAHRLPPFRAILDGTIDRAAYGRLLVALAAWHDDLAPACTAAARHAGLGDVDRQARRRRERLHCDLAVLGLDGPSRGKPRSVPSPSPRVALGSLYTVHGSFLGGRILHRRLDRLLSGSDGRSYFHADPAEADGWRRLTAAVDVEAAGPGGTAAMVRGARLAFERLLAAVGEGG